MFLAAHQNPYTAAIQNVSFLVQLPTLHCFRAYLGSGPPATKTLVHGLLISLTYGIQALQIHGLVFTNLGYLAGNNEYISYFLKMIYMIVLNEIMNISYMYDYFLFTRK